MQIVIIMKKCIMQDTYAYNIICSFTCSMGTRLGDENDDADIHTTSLHALWFQTAHPLIHLFSSE